MNKVLFILQSYPSVKSANVWCDEKIIEELNKCNDFDIHVLCCKYNGNKKYEEVNGIKVHRWNRGFFWMIFCWGIYHEGTILGKYIYFVSRILLRIKQIAFIPFFPFYEPILIFKIKRAAKKLCKKQEFDLILSEYHGLETLYAGYYLKKKGLVKKFIPIFWDPLSGGIRPKYLPKSFIDKRKSELERRIISLSERSIAMDAHKDYLYKTWKGSPILEKIIFLGIPRFEFSNENAEDKVRSENDTITMVYSGNMSQRNPAPFFKALSEVKTDRKIQVVFYTRKIFHEAIKKSYDNFSGGKYELKLSDYIARRGLIEVLKKADYLLSFGCDNVSAVPSKIYEYISLRRPIVHSYCSNNDPTLDPLKKYDACLLIDESWEASRLASSLGTFINNIHGSNLSFRDLKEIYYNNMPISYCNVIRDILNRV